MNTSHTTVNADASIAILKRWAAASEKGWVDHPASSSDSAEKLGYYGTGYNSWGVQTNQKYLAAMAMLGVRTNDRHAIARALAAFRFSLRSHVAAQDHPASITCTDNTRWGCTWISPLGIERMMFAVHALEPHLTDNDKAALQRMLIAEAIWHHDHHDRGAHSGIHAGKWNHSGKNNPESNIWTGALLWRTAALYPHHPQAHHWRDKAESFLFNGISIDADKDHPRYVGSNFFPNFALDHHGYLNVGYMIICTSNAAYLHFDLKQKNLIRPEYLDHHQRDLWQVIRPMIFDDGRLARIGGDSRLRYTYCQEYLLPALMYAADRLGDDHAMSLVKNQINLIETECQFSGDGSFYGRRLASLEKASPYYYTRLEADRAAVLASVIAYEPLIESHAKKSAKEEPVHAITSWHEPEHGAVLHRTKERFASFAWRAHGYSQGMCLPPDRSDLAEWSWNLAGRVRFVGEPAQLQGGQTPHRKLISQQTRTFEGGFVTVGSISEGNNLSIPEGMRLDDLATHHLCFAALPDGHSVIGLQLVRMNDKRAHACEIKGMNLNIPNDLYNKMSRTLDTAHGPQVIQSPARRDELLNLKSNWACVDQTIGVVGLYGATSLTLDRTTIRRGGYYQSLHVDQLCWYADNDTIAYEPQQIVLDVGWRVMANVNSATTQKLAGTDQHEVHEPQSLTRSVTIMGCDGKHYRVTADFEKQHATVDAQ